MSVKPPLVAVLKTSTLELVREVELPAEMIQFPDMIEMVEDIPAVILRQFFRIGITDRRAFYREGVSYRITSS